MPFTKRDLIVQAPPLEPKKAQWIVKAPLEWHHDTETDAHFEVPVGSDTDFASVPQVLWWLLPPWQRTYVRPAVLHDFLSRPADEPPVPQHQADRVFRLAMKDEGVPAILMWLMWALVRWRRLDLFRAVGQAGPWQMLGALAIGAAVLPIAIAFGGTVFLFSLTLRLAGFVLDLTTLPLRWVKYTWGRQSSLALGVVTTLGSIAVVVIGASLGWPAAAGWYPYVGALGIAAGITLVGPQPERPRLARVSAVMR